MAIVTILARQPCAELYLLRQRLDKQMIYVPKQNPFLTLSMYSIMARGLPIKGSSDISCIGRLEPIRPFQVVL